MDIGAFEKGKGKKGKKGKDDGKTKGKHDWNKGKYDFGKGKFGKHDAGKTKGKFDKGKEKGKTPSPYFEGYCSFCNKYFQCC